MTDMFGRSEPQHAVDGTGAFDPDALDTDDLHLSELGMDDLDEYLGARIDQAPISVVPAGPVGTPPPWRLLDGGRLNADWLFGPAGSDIGEPTVRPEPGYGWRRPAPRGRVRRRSARSPAAGLAWLIVLGLLAAFFGWFSAGPLWLSLGHGVTGTATVVTCSVHGIAGRCADFTPDGGAYPATRVNLLGLGKVTTGQQVTARMVSRGGWQAYAGDGAGLYLRWIPGLVAVLLCGFGIAWGTGAARLPGRRRPVAVLASVAGPILLAAGLFAAAW
jgi:hypothetical protein